MDAQQASRRRKRSRFASSAPPQPAPVRVSPLPRASSPPPVSPPAIVANNDDDAPVQLSTFPRGKYKFAAARRNRNINALKVNSVRPPDSSSKFFSFDDDDSDAEPTSIRSHAATPAHLTTSLTKHEQQSNPEKVSDQQHPSNVTTTSSPALSSLPPHLSSTSNTHRNNQSSHNSSKSAGIHANNHSEITEEDPLDSFMQILQNASTNYKSKRARTSALANMFDDAIDNNDAMSDDENANGNSNSHSNQKSKPKRVYEKVDHSKIDYPSFEKNLYIPVPELLAITQEQLIKLRQSLDNIRVRGRNCPHPISEWAQCGLSNALLNVLKQYEYITPTPIQAQAIPCVMSGRDVIGIAKTGSGKTLAFLLPLLRHIARRSRSIPGDGPSALIIAPTRELAIQIYREASRFAKAIDIHCVCAYGGNGLKDQIAEIKRGVDLIICTPGRMIDLLAMNSGRVCNLKRVTFIVLDEADRMFDMGFEPQLMRIIENIRPDKQTVMFSATFPMQVEKLARKILIKPIEIQVGGNSVTSSTIDQHIEVRNEDSKFFRLLELLGNWYEKGNTLVFVDRQDNADRIFRDLSKAKYKCLSLHGGMDQADRDSTIVDFKNGDIKVLVATSVAARGLDVKNLTLVVNYDVPSHYEDYVHRVGRTGRAGRSGTAYTFITSEQESFAPDLVKALEKSIKVRITQQGLDNGLDKENIKQLIDQKIEKEIPKDLKQLVQSFESKRKAGIVKYGSKSGYGGRGFKFEENDDEYNATKTAMRKMQAKQYGIEDEVGLDDDEDNDDNHDNVKSTAKNSSANSNIHGDGIGRRSDESDEDNEDDDIIEITSKTSTSVAATQSRINSKQIAASESKHRRGPSTVQMKKPLSEEETKELLEEATRKAEKDAIANNLDDNKKRALIAQVKLQFLSTAFTASSGGTRGTVPGPGAASSGKDGANHQSNGMSPENNDEDGDRSGVRFAGELEINDYPSNARWQVVRKGALSDVEEFTGCVVTTRGNYYPPGRNPPAGERKLHFLIEGLSRSAVKMARRDIKQKLEESSNVSRPGDNQYTKYSVV